MIDVIEQIKNKQIARKQRIDNIINQQKIKTFTPPRNIDTTPLQNLNKNNNTPYYNTELKQNQIQDNYVDTVFNKNNNQNTINETQNNTTQDMLSRLRNINSNTSLNNIDFTQSNTANNIDTDIQPKKTGNQSIDTAITKYANTYNVPDKLIYAVIKNESSFNNKAVSRTGNKGLMQVSDGLLKGSNVTNWQDSDSNIMVGTKYLSYLQKYFDGDMEKAIAAYNAGEGRVGKLVKKYGDDWKSHLPEETKKYLPKVLNDYYK